MNDPTMRRVTAFFAIILAVMIAVAVASVRNINRSVAGSDWVNHTHSVILEAEALRSDLSIGDGAAHAFAVTGNARDRSASLSALSNVAEHVEIVSALTRNEPAQRDLVGRLAAQANERSDYLRQLLGSRQSGDTKAVHALLEQDAGEPALAEIERSVDRLKTDELGLLTERDTASFLQAETTRWTVWTGVVMDLVLLAGVGWLIRDDIAARRRAAAALQTLNNELETRVAARTAELAAANELLKTENIERRWANVGLEHQLHYNQLIINSINDLVLLLTKASNITRINTAVTRTTGWEAHELIDKPFAEFARLVFEGPAPLTDPVAQAMNDARELRDQVAVVEDRRGRKITAKMTLFPLRDGDKVVGCILVLQPITPTQTLLSGTPQHN